jgi:hypothetical protein
VVRADVGRAHQRLVLEQQRPDTRLGKVHRDPHAQLVQAHHRHRGRRPAGHEPRAVAIGQQA